MTTLSLIAAMAENRVIGRDNAMPWHLPADLKHFKELTWGKPVIMGRRTYHSIGRALPGRTNIVLTRDHAFRAPGCLTATSDDQALELAGPVPEVMVMGGANLYELYLRRATRIYLTLIHATIHGDTLFPPFEGPSWALRTREDHGPDDRNPLAYSFLVFDRID